MIKLSTIIYLQIGSATYTIPINPTEFKNTYPTDNSDYKVLGLGQVMVPLKPDLQVISWDSYFPAVSDLTESPGRLSPKPYVDAIRGARDNLTVCRLIITRSGIYDTNIACLVTNFETTDKGGEPGDMYYTIELTEYRAYEPEIIKVQTSKDKKNSAAKSKKKGKKKKKRANKKGKLRVGCTVVVNGKYWYDSYGAKPYGTANNLREKVNRIVTASGRAYPIHISGHGWVKKSQVKVVD